MLRFALDPNTREELGEVHIYDGSEIQDCIDADLLEDHPNTYRVVHGIDDELHIVRADNAEPVLYLVSDSDFDDDDDDDDGDDDDDDFENDIEH